MYFQKHGYTRTLTLPASLVAVSECMSMAGIAHITISPPLLKALNTTDAEELSSKPELISLFDKKDIVEKVARDVPDQPLNLIDDEERFRILFTRIAAGLVRRERWKPRSKRST